MGDYRIIYSVDDDRVVDPSVEGLEGFKLTPYFERRVVNDPVRRRRVLPYVADAVNDPEETMTQPDGKVRYWRYVPELEHHIRVVTTADGALFNAHEDSAYTRRQRRQ
jgi:hypothetical protein